MEKAERKLLVLDLDETLIYAAEEPMESAPDFIVGQYYVYRRPYLKEFLKFCFDNFEVAIWTSSTRNYAERIIENLVDSKNEISFHWARDRCTISYDA